MTSHYNMYSTSLSIGILIGSRHRKHFNTGNIVRLQRTEIAYQHFSGKFYLPIIYIHLRAGRTINGNPLVGQPYSGCLLKEFYSVFVLCGKAGQYRKYQASHAVSHLPDNTFSP